MSENSKEILLTTSENNAYFFTKDKNYPFFLYAIGESDCDYIYNNVGKELQKHYLIGYVSSGNGTVFENDSTYSICSQDVFILHPGAERKVSSDSKNPLKLLWIMFSGKLAEALFELYDLDKCAYFSNIAIFHNMETLLQIAKTIEPDDEFMSNCSVHFMEIVQKLYIHNVKNLSDAKPLTTAEKMKQIIDSMGQYDLSMTELAKQVYCSRNHAIRLFRNKFGISPYKYISDLRLKNAKKMLKNSNLPIGEIAKLLGFCDSRYFSSWFKTHEKTSPKEFRLKSYK